MKDKKLTNWLVVLLILSIGVLFFHFSPSLASARAQRIPIFMYHYVETPSPFTTLPGLYVSPFVFEKQLQELRRYHFNPVFVSEVAAALRQNTALPKYSIALTFDDGYQDFYDQVFPLLKEYQVKATVYVIVNKVGQPGYLKEEQLKELVDSGLVEIGSHTFNHLDLKKISLAAAKYEIAGSKLELGRLSGQPILTFAYPFGRYHLEHLRIVQEAGYQAAISVDSGVIQSLEGVWLLKRVRPGERTGREFSRWLFSLYRMKY